MSHLESDRVCREQEKVEDRFEMEMDGWLHRHRDMGYHEETILHQQEDDEPLDYRRQIDRIGYIQEYILNMQDTMFMEDAGKALNIFQVAKERLEAEKNERFKKEKA